MTKKQLAIALIFIVIAGAVAGAFIFLSRTDSARHAALPSSAESTGISGMPQELPHAVYSGKYADEPEYPLLLTFEL